MEAVEAGKAKDVPAEELNTILTSIKPKISNVSSNM